MTYASPNSTDYNYSTNARWVCAQQNPYIFLSRFSFLNLNSSTGANVSTDKYFKFDFDAEPQTSSGILAGQLHKNTSQEIYELRRLSGLTWEQIGEIFGVTRRSVHFWANGKPMEDIRAEKLNYLMDIIKRLDTGLSFENRRLILNRDNAGVSLFDLFKKGDIPAANMRVPITSMRPRIELKPLSQRARAERMPVMSPYDLLDADNSRIESAESKATLVSPRRIRKAKRK